ncbi:MAG: Jag N-terminal domain-containing protein [Candidatus Margulisbacteria bacterium]|nr:Jag N-terminal domain-containing protein [Candidatus Margulisiibacteriota bacterium]
MKKIRMKGKTVDEAVAAALQVLGGEKDKAKVTVISEGKPAMLGVLGGADAEVEVALSEGLAEDARKVLQEILDKMVFMAMVEGSLEGDRVELKIKGEDMGRIIGKEGATLRCLEIIVGSILGRQYGERVRVGIDADGYKDKRNQAFERLAKEAAKEVAETKQEKVLPPMNAADRRIIHLSLQDDAGVTTYSKGEGRDRRLVIAPK